jgi:hypothetical protein
MLVASVNSFFLVIGLIQIGPAEANNDGRMMNEWLMLNQTGAFFLVEIIVDSPTSVFISRALMVHFEARTSVKTEKVVLLLRGCAGAP